MLILYWNYNTQTIFQFVMCIFGTFTYLKQKREADANLSKFWDNFFHCCLVMFVYILCQKVDALPFWLCHTGQLQI